MIDMNIPLFDSIRKACKSMDKTLLNSLAPLSYTIFHISQSTEGVKEETGPDDDAPRKSIMPGRDIDNVNSNLSEYLASFVLYSGSCIS